MFSAGGRIADHTNPHSVIRSFHRNVSGLLSVSTHKTTKGLLSCIAVGVELTDVGPQILDLLLVLDAWEDHFGPRDLRRWIFNVLLERILIPHNARVLVGIGVFEIRHRTCLTAVEAIELRADFVLRAGMRKRERLYSTFA